MYRERSYAGSILSDATEFRYKRETQPLPKIGPWRERLDALLLDNEGKAIC